MCVIGGTGHVGGFLVPALVREGHEVTVVATGRTPVPEGPEWGKVKLVRARYERGSEEWGRIMKDLGLEALVDMLGADLPGTYRAVKGTCRHLVACGSLWMLGPPKVVPTPEQTQGPCEFEGYARRYEEIYEVMEVARRDGMAFTAIFPPNICGPGKVPLEPKGGRDPSVHLDMAKGKPVFLPEGTQALIGPCDAEDVAQGFVLALRCPDEADGEVFNVGSAYALTAVRFVQVYGEIYRTEIPVEFVPWEEFTRRVPDLGANYHFREHMCPDISKIRKKLGYEPRHTPEESMERAVAWMRDRGMV